MKPIYRPLIISVLLLLSSYAAQATECQQVEMLIGLSANETPVLASILKEKGSDPAISKKISDYLGSVAGNCINFLIIPEDIDQALPEEAYIDIINVTNSGLFVTSNYMMSQVGKDANGKLTLLGGAWSGGTFSGAFPDVFSNSTFSVVFSKLSFSPRFEAVIKKDSTFIKAERVLKERIKMISSYDVLITAIYAVGYSRSAFAKNLWSKGVPAEESKKVLAVATVHDAKGKIFVDPRFLYSNDDKNIFDANAYTSKGEPKVFHPMGGSVHQSLYDSMVKELGYRYNGTSWVPSVNNAQ